MGLLSSFEVKEIREKSEKFNDMKKKCNLIPTVKPFDINNDNISETDSPEKLSIPMTIIVNNEKVTPKKNLDEEFIPELK